VADQKHDDGPLRGLRVLDLTEHMAGPFCTMILADMGAEVVKLERPGKGDSVRAWGDGSERNPYFRYINRNKKGITLDYKEPAGRALFLRLVETMDVLVENYRPTVMPRAGLGFDALREVNPRLIYAQLSGLGYDGPYAGRGGFDLIAQGMGGIMHVTGEPDGPPTSVGLPICDLGTGMWAVQGILAALYERQRTGKGRLVECSLLETAIGFSSWTSAQMTRRPRGADPPRLAPSPERALSAHADQGRLSDGGGRQGIRAAGMVRGPAFCDQSDAHGKP
jgi:crotonobetainyl-CoA:carnitine CoA-transferase CaiB-like acyl-CoA transferase